MVAVVALASPEAVTLRADIAAQTQLPRFPVGQLTRRHLVCEVFKVSLDGYEDEIFSLLIDWYQDTVMIRAELFLKK